MGRWPIKTRVTLRCQECGDEFESKRCDTKYCVPCRVVVTARQTKESCERNREKRNARARESTWRKSRQRRNAINKRLRERYANDPAYRTHTKEVARYHWYLGGHGRASYKLQRNRSKAWRKKHPSVRNGQQTAKFRKDACECCGLDDPRVLAVHHKVPFSKGGLTVADNLETLCYNCHKVAHYEMGS